MKCLLLQLLYVLLCSIELLSNFIFKTFKIAPCHIEHLHCKTLFYSNFKKLWLVQIVFPIARNLSKINIRKISKPFQSLTTIDLLHKLFLKSSNQSTGQATNRKFENTLIGFLKKDVYFIEKRHKILHQTKSN